MEIQTLEGPTSSSPDAVTNSLSYCALCCFSNVQSQVLIPYRAASRMQMLPACLPACLRVRFSKTNKQISCCGFITQQAGRQAGRQAGKSWLLLNFAKQQKRSWKRKSSQTKSLWRKMAWIRQHCHSFPIWSTYYHYCLRPIIFFHFLLLPSTIRNKRKKERKGGSKRSCRRVTIWSSRSFFFFTGLKPRQQQFYYLCPTRFIF